MYTLHKYIPHSDYVCVCVCTHGCILARSTALAPQMVLRFIQVSLHQEH